MVDIHWVGRPFVAILFVFTVPGGAIIGLLDLPEGATVWSLRIGLSVAIVTAVSQVMLWTGGWDPATATVALGAATAPLLGRQLGLVGASGSGRGTDNRRTEVADDLA